MPMSVGPRCSRVRSWIGPWLSWMAASCSLTPHDAGEALRFLRSRGRAGSHCECCARARSSRVDLGVQAAALGVLLALGVGERPVGQPAVGVDPAVDVVDRHPALAVIDVAREGDRHQRVVGHQELGNAPVLVGRVGLARRADDQPGVVAPRSRTWALGRPSPSGCDPPVPGRRRLPRCCARSRAWSSRLCVGTLCRKEKWAVSIAPSRLCTQLQSCHFLET